MAPDVNDPELVGWTIFTHPEDFPEHYVARRWVTSEVGALPTEDVLIADTLEELRAKLPRGLVLTHRMPQDDPAIVEIWI